MADATDHAGGAGQGGDMAIRMKGIVIRVSEGVVTVEFRSAANAEKVKAFLEANMGKELEIILATTGEEGKATGEKGTGKGNLSSCANAGYWNPKKAPIA